MNKKKLDRYMSRALTALQDEEHCKVVQNGKCKPGYRSQISAFGASVEMGSLKAAALFYAEQGSADVDRSLLLSAMYYIIYGEWKEAKAVAERINANDSRELRNEYLTAAVALKLALNAFISEKKSE